jgi:hypothetical protein
MEVKTKTAVTFKEDPQGTYSYEPSLWRRWNFQQKILLFLPGCNGRPKVSLSVILVFQNVQFLKQFCWKSLSKFLFSYYFVHCWDFPISFWHILSSCSYLWSKSIYQFFCSHYFLLLSLEQSINDHFSLIFHMATVF